MGRRYVNWILADNGIGVTIPISHPAWRTCLSTLSSSCCRSPGPKLLTWSRLLWRDIAEHTSFPWYVSIVKLSRRCPCFDRMTATLCFRLLKDWSFQGSISTPQVSLHSGWLPSVFGCLGHVCKLAVRPDVDASISSNITFAACFGHRCIRASQAKSLPFQHGKSFFIRDGCHRCSDAWGTSASSPFDRTLPLRSSATSPLRRVLVIGALVRPKLSGSRFNAANQSSFGIAAIGVRMRGARLQARHLSGRCRFDQQQHHFCGAF